MLGLKHEESVSRLFSDSQLSLRFLCVTVDKSHYCLFLPLGPPQAEPPHSDQLKQVGRKSDIYNMCHLPNRNKEDVH